MMLLRGLIVSAGFSHSPKRQTFFAKRIDLLCFAGLLPITLSNFFDAALISRFNAF